MKFKKLFTFSLILLMTKLVSQDLKYKLPIIIDADTANEIDDLFAITRALGEDSFELLGITAAQFHTSPYATSNSAVESHEMNKKLIDLIPNYKVPLKKGSSQPLEKINKPKVSEASKFIISQARRLEEGKKLQIVILGSCTNVASALIEAPEIASKLVISYVGFWHNSTSNTYDKNEFNSRNDILATNYLLNFIDLDFRVMSATTSKHLVFDKVRTFKYLSKSNLGNFLKNRWNTYKRWWTVKDPEQNKWIMWDLALIEAIANPDLAKLKSFETPIENVKRNINIYTFIDTLKMKSSFWKHYNRLVE